jgi:glutamate racemase
MTIGIFDSGIGGLTVFKAISEAFPSSNLIYFGDTARFPYGTKSKTKVIEYACENTEFLLRQGAEIIVIACNTATAAALPTLKKKFSRPIVGVIEGAVLGAVTTSRNGRIGVIATNRTVQENSYEEAICSQKKNAQVFSYPCPLLVSAIEEGNLPHAIITALLTHYLSRLKDHEIDTLILGCTHYPILKEEIKREMGPLVQIIDPAMLCIESIRPYIPKGSQTSPIHRFFVSDDPCRFKQLGQLFLGQDIHSIEVKKDH